MDGHLDSEQRQGGNKRNGKGSKTIKSTAGSFQIETPQDRQSSFDPQLIKLNGRPCWPTAFRTK